MACIGKIKLIPNQTFPSRQQGANEFDVVEKIGVQWCTRVLRGEAGFGASKQDRGSLIRVA